MPARCKRRKTEHAMSRRRTESRQAPPSLQFRDGGCCPSLGRSQGGLVRVGETKHPDRGKWGKPLAAVRVLAAEQMQALPYATQLLAHLGAEVVKVEPPERGETGRASTPFLVDEDGRRVGATYLCNNLSKRSVAIDLKHEAGRALFRRLVPHFDVVAENFRAGSMEALGLGYESI